MRREYFEIPYEGLIDNEKYAYIDWTGDSDKLRNFINNYWPSNETLWPADGFLIQQSWLQDDFNHENRTENFRNYPYIPSVSLFFLLLTS